jgi:hypothetical protein
MLWWSISKETDKANDERDTMHIIHQHIICVKGKEDKNTWAHSVKPFFFFLLFLHCHAITPLRQKDEPACCVHLVRSERDS